MVISAKILASRHHQLPTNLPNTLDYLYLAPNLLAYYVKYIYCKNLAGGRCTFFDYGLSVIGIAHHASKIQIAIRQLVVTQFIYVYT